MVRGGLACGIGRVRLVGTALGEKTLGPERAVDLVRRDVQEAKTILGFPIQSPPVLERRLQQHAGAQDVGLEEDLRCIDRTVDVAFGRQIEHRLGAETGEGGRHLGAICDVSDEETVARQIGNLGEIVPVAGIGQLVDVQDVIAFVADQRAHQSRSNEAGSAGDQ